jgi:hypothetical protein
MPTPGTMTPNRFRIALASMRISQRDLTNILHCSTRLVADWGVGRVDVPPAVETWLEACIANRAKHPDPKPPEDWRRRDPRFTKRRAMQREEERIKEENAALLREQKEERRRVARAKARAKAAEAHEAETV